jgi:hypothetical protein
LSTIKKSGWKAMVVAKMILFLISRTSVASSFMERGRYCSLVTLIIPGIRTKSILKGLLKRPARSEPVMIRILAGLFLRFNAMARHLRMCPRP